MKRTNRTTINPWTTALMAAGVVSAASVATAEEAGSPVTTALQPTTISGYVNTSAILKFGGRANNSYDLPGRSYDTSDKMNNINLDVVSLTIEKGLDESTWAAGYNISLLFGPDANTLNTTSVAGGNTSDFAIRNAYVNLRAPVGNGLDIKMGVWDTIIGYEVFDAGGNPNYSRSYAFWLEPIIQTGILMSYDVNEVLSASAGISTEGMSGDGRAPYMVNGRTADDGDFAYIGSVTLTAPESAGFLAGSALTGGMLFTPMQSAGRLPAGARQQNYYNFYVGGSMPLPITGLSAGLAYDHAMGHETTHAQAVGGYLVYQATPKLNLAGRIEWAEGSDGSWSANGFDDQYLGLTFTVDYSLWANVISRVEFRWDQDLESGSKSFGVDGNGQENAFQLALNVIYNF
jgi:hypothetical protein